MECTIKFSEIFRKYRQPDDFIDAFDALDKLLELLCKNRDYYLDCINSNINKLVDFKTRKNLCNKDTEEMEILKSDCKKCHASVLYLNALMYHMVDEFEKKYNFRHYSSKVVNYNMSKLYEILVEGKENDKKETERLIKAAKRRLSKSRSGSK